jgi:hypothetical protein
MWDLAAGTELGSQNTKYEKSGGEKLGSLSVFGASKAGETAAATIQEF